MSRDRRQKVVRLARRLIGQAAYVLGVDPRKAPGEVDCSSLTMWAFMKAAGISMPRLSRQQARFGRQVHHGQEKPGDLIFTRGKQGSARPSRTKTVGHVGIVTGEGTVIHAASAKKGVIESPISSFLKPSKFRGICRVLNP